MTDQVLLVDDERLIRAGLRAIIDAEPDLTVVGEAADGAEVLPLVAPAAARRGADGRADARASTASRPPGTSWPPSPDPPRVLVVTTFENDEYVYDALRAGAQRLPAQAGPARGDRAGDPDGRARRVPAVPGGDPRAGRRARRPRGRRPRCRRGAAHRAGGRGAAADGHGPVERGDRRASWWSSLETVKTHVGNVLAKLAPATAPRR